MDRFSFKLKRGTTEFHNLMRFRVREILIVSSLYDAFVLEEDGRLSERLLGDYLDMDLRFVPRITHTTSAREALEALSDRTFDLVITTTRISDMHLLEFYEKVKETGKDIPVILLTYEPIDQKLMDKIRETGAIAKVFHWSGNTKILMSIVKCIEDNKNAPEDISLGVQVILIIEDEPEAYSYLLPKVYTELMTHTKSLIAEGINPLDRMLRMRARPKILLADSFEEGLRIYETYKNNLLGVIMDTSFPKDGLIDQEAGLKFSEIVKREVPDLPVLLQSGHESYREKASEHNLGFINKKSETLLEELGHFIKTNFGFGDFVFRMPNGEIIGRAGTLDEFAALIQQVPGESIEYHSGRNHISIWLRARTEFELADYLRPKKVSDFPDTESLREFLYSEIINLIERQRSGVISDFKTSDLDVMSSFVRLGSGSLGGKARGIAFVNSLLAGGRRFEKFPEVIITTPPSYVLCTDLFDQFIESNNLRHFALESDDDREIADSFLKGKMPSALEKDLRTLIENINFPLAVRSSSLLEDSQALPFAGLYSTYMLPNNHPDPEVRLRQLIGSIKFVYASVFYKSPKMYIRSASYRVEEEKMAVIIQQIAGQQHDDIYYPTISGVAQSYSFYPAPYMLREDGIMHLALGLGKIIVEGEQIFTISPTYPKKNPIYSSPQDYLKNSQKNFYALSLFNPAIEVSKEEDFSLLSLDLGRAEKDESLSFIGSTYSAEKNAIQDTIEMDGPRIVTFARILKYNTFPLAEIVRELLDLGMESFGTDVEIEFAINLYTDRSMKPEFYFLQIRPIATEKYYSETTIETLDKKKLLCSSRYSLGDGIISDIYDIIYVDPENFDLSKSREIAQEIAEVNSHLTKEKRKYILIGFGRWGSTDPWLGIPILWHHISGAKVIIESNLNSFNVDPSYGSHFFHNIIAQKIGYFHIRGEDETEFIDWKWLKNQRVQSAKRYIRHVRFDKPAVVKIDGRTSRAVILKP